MSIHLHPCFGLDNCNAADMNLRSSEYQKMLKIVAQYPPHPLRLRASAVGFRPALSQNFFLPHIVRSLFNNAKEKIYGFTVKTTTKAMPDPFGIAG